ncbi:MAG: hypothetical protein JKX69_06525 [Rhodobacteraceae bacterium]|nr:hypothetical protein [Paracoccaceae bacterium]
MRILSAFLALLPLPALAESFSLPAGCTAYLTIQNKGCGVSHHFHCDNDPEGYQRRVDLDADGINYVGSIDYEARWMESFHVYSNHSEQLEGGSVDSASMTELFAYGYDTYDFQTLSEEIGTTRYIGQDRLTGETVEIDGIMLEQTEYIIRALDSDGIEKWRSEGHEFVSRDWRMFISGAGRVTTPSDSFDTDDSPVQFILPGQNGFLTDTPIFGCSVVMSSFEVAG